MGDLKNLMVNAGPCRNRVGGLYPERELIPRRDAFATRVQKTSSSDTPRLVYTVALCPAK